MLARSRGTSPESSRSVPLVFWEPLCLMEGLLFEDRLRLEERVPCPELWLLDRQPNLRPVGEMLTQLFGLMTNNYNHRRGIQSRGRCEHVIDEWAPGGLM